jgi:hypothetical protein
MHFVIATSRVPPTPAETAADSARWERRGLLRRLVRLEDPIAPPEERSIVGARP